MEKFILSDKNFKKSRLPSLYSDFSHLQQTNIEGYTANLTSWKFLLLNIINNHNELLCQDDVISFDSSTLVDQLTVRDATLTYKPKGLPEVLNSMINEDDRLYNNEKKRKKSKKTEVREVYNLCKISMALSYIIM